MSLKVRFVFFMAIAAILSLTGCDGNNDDLVQLPNGSMQAQIDGNSWQATSAVAAFRSGTVFGVSGVRTDGSTIAFGGIASTGGHTLGTGSPANATYTESAQQDAAIWTANSLSGSGSFTIDELDDTHIAGRFEFVLAADPNSPASGSTTISEGSFDIQFTTPPQ